MLFEALGGAARTSAASPAARRVLGTWSNRHAEHAAAWRARIPAIAGRELAGDVDRAWVGAHRAAIEADAVGALAGTVLDDLHRRAADQRARVDARLDGPSARRLDLLLADLVAERADLAGLTPLR